MEYGFFPVNNKQYYGAERKIGITIDNKIILWNFAKKHNLRKEIIIYSNILDV